MSKRFENHFVLTNQLAGRSKSALQNANAYRTQTIGDSPRAELRTLGDQNINKQGERLAMKNKVIKILRGTRRGAFYALAFGLLLTQSAAAQQQGATIPQKMETLRDVPFPGGVDLQYLI